MTEPFNLQDFIRQSGKKRFIMDLTEVRDDLIEMSIYPEGEPDNSRPFYIEKNAILSKFALSLRDIYKKHRPNKKFNSKNLYKDMKR